MVLFAVRGGKNLITTFDIWSGYTTIGELNETNGGSVRVTCSNKVATIENKGGTAISIIAIII